MNALTRYGAMAVVVGIAGAMAGQNEIHNSSRSNPSYVQTSKLIGRKAKSSEGEEIGVIKDVVIDRATGCMAYTVLSTGGKGTGITDGAGKLVAVPWVAYSPISDLTVLTITIDRKKIFNAPAFDYTRMDEYARLDYIDNIYSYYGFSPGPRSAVAAGTDATGTAGATASPGEVASTPAGRTGSANAKPSARTHGSSVANFDAASKRNRSAKGVRSATTIGASPSVERGETAPSTTIEKHLLGSATGQNEKKSSQRKAVEDRSNRRPSATPESADGQD